jgi:uncharacterized protein YkwD
VKKLAILILFCVLNISAFRTWAQSGYYSFPLDSFRFVRIFNDTVDLVNPDLTILNAVIFYLTNDIRKSHKLKIIEYQPLLEKSASIHSENMVKQSFFSHNNPRSRKFKTPEDRARFVGIANPFIAENIIESFVLQYKQGKNVYTGGKGIFMYKLGGKPIKAHTYLSLGETVLNDWMNSPGHRSNILSKDAKQLGCGTAFFLKHNFNDMPTIMATQNFQLYQSIIEVSQ